MKKRNKNILTIYIWVLGRFNNRCSRNSSYRGRGIGNITTVTVNTSNIVTYAPVTQYAPSFRVKVIHSLSIISILYGAICSPSVGLFIHANLSSSSISIMVCPIASRNVIVTAMCINLARAVYCLWA